MESLISRQPEYLKEWGFHHCVGLTTIRVAPKIWRARMNIEEMAFNCQCHTSSRNFYLNTHFVIKEFDLMKFKFISLCQCWTCLVFTIPITVRIVYQSGRGMQVLINSQWLDKWQITYFQKCFAHKPVTIRILYLRRYKIRVIRCFWSGRSTSSSSYFSTTKVLTRQDSSLRYLTSYTKHTAKFLTSQI